MLNEERHVVVGDQRLHVRISGTVSALPTVVLEAGGGSILETWRGMEQLLAAHTRVLSYERAGIGESAGPAESVLAQATAQRLDALLKATGIHGPVMLVGHSLGGLHMRYFAATRPDRVAGLVLLDTTPEDLPFPRFFTWKPTIVMWLLHGLARLGLVQPLLKRLTPAGKAPGISPQQIAALARFRHVKTVLTEIGALEKIQAEVAVLPTTAAVPTLTLSAGQHAPSITPDQVARFRRSHEQLAALGAKPYSRHHRMEGATHMSLLTDPAQAAAAAALILEFARQITPPISV